MDEAKSGRRRRRGAATVVPALALKLALAACAGPARHGAADGTPLPRPLATAPDRADAPSMLERLELVPLGRERVDGLLQVRYTLANPGADPIDLACAVDWYDTAGRRLGDRPAAWFALRLPAGSQAELHASAPDPAADTWGLRAVAYPWPPVEPK